VAGGDRGGQKHLELNYWKGQGPMRALASLEEEEEEIKEEKEDIKYYCSKT